MIIVPSFGSLLFAGFIVLCIYIYCSIKDHYRRKDIEESIARANIDPKETHYGGADGVERVYAALEYIISSHQDYTAEVHMVDIDSHGFQFTRRLNPGTKIGLTLVGEEVHVTCNNVDVGTLKVNKAKTRLPQVLAEGRPVDAYLSGRDLTTWYLQKDHCQILAFYKVDGVPPTKVNLS